MQPFIDYRFSKEHTWVKPKGEADALVGITPFAQEQLGGIVYADLPAIGATFKKDEVFGSIEALKTTSDLFMPVSGTILAINTRLNDEPNLVNDDALGEGWLIRIQPTLPEELDTLLDQTSYDQIITH
ncbi:glycine cleavage system protein GcvH [Dinghuibacter silviterrae]|uniref:Glycine cleavage system H protein n=1 Tax=Dinghuibacter silviterrae TaxID=1539049 RepID=A0A4R8DVS2_9BACT|nr:glycine cleavage system protein GcvH [Dinghuibacter silviterrae]TDX01517.1 glycine cleavage system H protein [Dinghuibacter silviterrae]